MVALLLKVADVRTIWVGNVHARVRVPAAIKRADPTASAHPQGVERDLEDEDLQKEKQIRIFI